jgi:glyoxylase-like metal-dependent hydrolase (beta-lactamase superfamily II)
MRLREPVQVADGVFRLGSLWVNMYLVIEGRAAFLVDAGYPRYGGAVEEAAARVGLRLSDIEAVVVTHHHVDHAGTAEHLRSAGATVYAMAADEDIVRGERPSHPPQGFYGQAWRPTMMRYLAHTVRAGGARYRPVGSVAALEGDDMLDLPGRPRVLASPGHTAGHCSVLLEERGVLFVGDALVNFDYASGARGVRLHRFNEDREQARASLAHFDGIVAETLLFGHGDPWTRGVKAAIASVPE